MNSGIDCRNQNHLKAYATSQSAYSDVRKRASALVTTLLVLVVLSTIVIAFLQSMSIERAVAKSSANTLKAELAAEAGLNQVIAQVLTLADNDNFIVLSATNSQNQTYTFVGSFSNAPAGSIVFHPLVSGGVAQTNAYTNMPSVAALFSSSSALAASNRPLLDNNRKIDSRWIYLTNSAGETNSRYAYWVEDLQGSINILTAGNTNGINTNTSTRVQVRPTGTNFNEIALFALFSSNSTDSGNTEASTIISNRSLVLSAETGKQLSANATNLCIIPPYTDRLIVPYGFNYPNQGSERRNINELIALGGDSAVQAISSVITSNLTNFSSIRQGGFPSSHDYAKTIAANIVDYADADNSPTVSASLTNSAVTSGKYRGIEAQPYISEFAERLEYVSKSKNAAGNWIVVIRVTPFVELWNFSDQTVSGSFAFDNRNEDIVKAGFNDPKLKNFITSGSITNSPSVNVSGLTPNSYTVVQLPSFTATIDCGLDEPAAIVNGNTSATRLWVNGVNGDPLINASSYVAYWNNVPFDMPGKNREQKGKTLRCQNPADPSPQNDFTCGLPAFRYVGPDRHSDIAAGPRYGDPRSTLYITAYDIAANSYANNASWKSRNVASFGGLRTVSPKDWPDGSHNSDNTVANGLNVNILPTAAPAPAFSANATNGFVYKISNAGTLTNICELGNIFDPAQWTGPTNTPWQPTTSDPGAGGGINLRIGKPEFSRFNTNSARAAQLLDLFSTTNVVRADGLVNLNTASFDALRALAVGITSDVTTDPLITPSSVRNLAVNGSTNAGAVFANTVISNRPFLSTSQLSWMTNANGQFFGNTNQYVPSVGIEWNDMASKEFFSKLYNLSTTKSRAFRVYSCGQLLSPDGKRPIATSNLVFNVVFVPQRDAAGAITGTVVEITYRRAL